MKKIFCALFFVFALCGTARTADIADPIAALEERRRVVGDMMEAATVMVVCQDSDGDWGLGSGFVVADGYIMTNGHVVDGAKKIFVMNNLLKPTSAKLVKMNFRKEHGGEDDFALIKFSSSAKLPVLLFNTQVRRMDRVSAWGFGSLTLQLDRSFGEVMSGNFSKLPPIVYTEGTVNAVVADGRRTNVIHTAPISRGNSGGPLVNGRGEVVGINTWGILDEVDGLLNASLPADRIVAFLSSAGVGAQVARGSQRPQPVASLPAAQPTTQTPTAQPKPPKPEPAAPTVADSMTAEAKDALQKAKAGDAEMQAFVGISYYDGSEGFPLNVGEAVKWLGAAAKQNNKLASGMLGIIHITEENYLDVKKGVNFLRAGADAMPEFQAFLAMLYYEGEYMGIARDEKESFKWASVAAKAGDADAKAQLAVLYYYGEGVNIDTKRALTLAQEAADEDSSLGKAILAWMYFYGNVVEEDLDKALTLAQSAAEEGDAAGQGLLGLLYYMGNGVEEDLESAEGWARRAAEQTNEFGQYILGLLYAEGNVVKKDLPTAWAYLDMAAAKGIKDAGDNRDEIAKKMSAAQKKQATDIQTKWKKAWGLI